MNYHIIDADGYVIREGSAPESMIPNNVKEGEILVLGTPKEGSKYPEEPTKNRITNASIKESAHHEILGIADSTKQLNNVADLLVELIDLLANKGLITDLELSTKSNNTINNILAIRRVREQSNEAEALLVK